MTPIHHQIVQALLPICLAETEKARKLREVNAPKDDKERELMAILQQGVRKNVNKDYVEWMLHLLAVALDKPELKEISLKSFQKKLEELDKGLNLTPFCIVTVCSKEDKLKANKNDPPDCFWAEDYLNKQLIVVHGARGDILGLDGRVVNNCLNNHKKEYWRIATEEEVELCLETLVQKQIKHILIDPLFAAALTGMFEEEEETVVEKTTPEPQKGKGIGTHPITGEVMETEFTQEDNENNGFPPIQ